MAKPAVLGVISSGMSIPNWQAASSWDATMSAVEKSDPEAAARRRLGVDESGCSVRAQLAGALGS